MITCHDIYTFIEKGNVKNPPILQKYSLLGLKKCRFIISISNFTKKELVNVLKIPKEKIIVIKNSINREMFQPIPKDEIDIIEPFYPEFKKILHVGTESERKDFLTLLKAFYLIRKEIKNIKLIRVGQPTYSHIIKVLGLEKDIIYLKEISNERLKDLYNLCDFFVFPSLYEGWGAPGLEAASCGTPVICSDIPIFREVYRDFPLYFPPKDFKTLANIILNDMGNENLKLELSKKGIELSKLYSWEKSSMKYLKLAKNIIENL
jgi:glycosyltransferase involved in cell wall biosynthesis